MDYQDIKTDLAEQILTITLNRPDRLNAFTLRMKDEVVHALAEADSNDDGLKNTARDHCVLVWVCPAAYALCKINARSLETIRPKPPVPTS